MTPRKSRLNQIVDESFAMELDAAQEADAMGYIAHVLVQATLPYRDPGDVKVWGRENGKFSLSIQPNWRKRGRKTVSDGIPYGTVPRLILLYLSNQAVKTQSREIYLGNSMSEFLESIKIGTATGGKNGSISRLKEQLKRLLTAHISCTIEDNNYYGFRHINICDGVYIWWNWKTPDHPMLWQSRITLSEMFYNSVVNAPVPLDTRAIDVLKGSSLKLDMYTWLSYRMSYVTKPVLIPWESLQMQFGSEYKQMRMFKAKFLKALKEVHLLYPKARLDYSEAGLQLKPSPTHIRRKMH